MYFIHLYVHAERWPQPPEETRICSFRSVIRPVCRDYIEPYGDEIHGGGYVVQLHPRVVCSADGLYDPHALFAGRSWYRHQPANTNQVRAHIFRAYITVPDIVHADTVFGRAVAQGNGPCQELLAKMAWQ